MTKRLVLHLPVEEIWDEAGRVSRDHQRDLNADDVKKRLQTGPVRFVVANVGHPLVWIPEEKCYDFWTLDGRPHLIDPEAARRGIQLEDFPDERGDLACEWSLGDHLVVVLSVWH